MRYFIVALLFMNMMVTAVEAKTYRWVDESGKVHYSDSKPATAASKEINIPGSYSFPDVDIKKAIPYEDFIPAQMVTLAAFELKLSGAHLRDVKVGHSYSGQNCQKKESELLWVSGNGLINDIQVADTFVSEFVRQGYALEYENTASDLGQDNRFTLKAQLTGLKLKQCIDKKTYRAGSRDDVYVKLNWILSDRLSRETLYEGSSEGIYKGITKVARENGTAQAIERAMVVAVNNILSDPDFAAAVGKPNQAVDKKDNFKPIPLNLKETVDTRSFKENIIQHQQSTVTIRTTKGHGSGVLISDAYILTNAHVVGDAYEVIVILEGEELDASVERIEPIRDVALLKLNGVRKTEQALLSVAPPQVGDMLFVIGTPLSEKLSHTVTSGILSAKRDQDGLPFYQTDAAINRGNSGGPIYNETGGLVAISVSGMMTREGAGLGLNYLIPIEDALKALNILRQNIAGEKEAAIPRPVDNEDALFVLYQAGLEAKQNGQFALAKDRLGRAVKSLAITDESEQATEIRDALYIALPISQAQKAIEEQRSSDIRKYLAPVHEYISDHPKRFEIAKMLADLEESAGYVEQVATMTDKVALMDVKMWMAQYYSENGQAPGTKIAVIDLLSKDLGRSLFNRYELLEYMADSTGFSMVFRNIEKNKKVILEADF